MFRGTLRYPGWCETMNKIGELGLLNEKERSDLAGLTFGEFTSRLIDSARDDLKGDLAAFLDVSPDSRVLSDLEWLGLLGDEPLPKAVHSPLDVLAARMLEKMRYAPGERDLLVMQHEFIARYLDHTEKTTSTMIDYGIPRGDSSMCRLVGLPAAVAAKMILQGKIDLVGVQVPVVSEIYEPVLAELKQMGISFDEKTERVD